MASLLLALAFLQAPPVPVADAGPAPLLRAIELDADAMLADPSLLAADSLALAVTCSRQADYKLSERGRVLAAGRLLPGTNPLRLVRPGLTRGSQTLLLLLELLEGGAVTRKSLWVKVTASAEEAPAPAAALSGSFTLEMVHSGRVIGFRKKAMTELLNLKTGPVTPVSDPGWSGSAMRSRPESSSLPLLGLAMALAKHLAQKKAEKRLQARHAEARKRKLETVIRRDGKEWPITVELQVE